MDDTLDVTSYNKQRRVERNFRLGTLALRKRERARAWGRLGSRCAFSVSGRREEQGEDRASQVRPSEGHRDQKLTRGREQTAVYYIGDRGRSDKDGNGKPGFLTTLCLADWEDGKSGKELTGTIFGHPGPL